MIIALILSVIYCAGTCGYLIGVASRVDQRQRAGVLAWLFGAGPCLLISSVWLLVLAGTS